MARMSSADPIVIQLYGCVGGIQRLAERHERQAVRPVLVVLPALVQHDVALRLEPLGRQRRQQIAHAIGLHPQRPIDGARRHDLPVVGPVGVGRAVEQRAGLLQRREVALVVMLGPFEHQVLEEMREAGAARPLVLGADVIPDVHGHDRHVMILVDDHVETVGERALGEGKIDVAGWS